MKVDEVIGFLGFAANVAGNVLVVRKSWHGYWVRIVSNLLWLASAHETSLSVSANAITFLGINVWGLVKWRLERRGGPRG